MDFVGTYPKTTFAQTVVKLDVSLFHSVLDNLKLTLSLEVFNV